MTENKTTQMKQIISKIDFDKIASYPQHPQSRTLRQIIRYSKRILDSSDEKEIFRLSINIAYNLDTICDPNKAGYVKDETEKKYWLEISKELFENTVGVKDKKRIQERTN